MTDSVRTSLLTTAEAAVAGIPDGAVVGIGGAITAAHPMALVRALIRRGVRDLTVVAPTAGLETDLLIAAGCVRKVCTSYVGAESAAPLGPAYRAGAEAGTLKIWDGDEAHLIFGLRAAAQGLPFLPWHGGLGTALTELNPELVEFDDPIEGRRLLAIPALHLDYALIFADVSDEYGNVQFEGTGYVDALVASAARKVVVQAERIVSNDVIRRAPERTRFWRDTAVVRAPWGTHPYSGAALSADNDHLRRYAKAVQAATGGDRAPLEGYLREFVLEPETHLDYLERVGIRRIAELTI